MEIKPSNGVVRGRDSSFSPQSKTSECYAGSGKIYRRCCGWKTDGSRGRRGMNSLTQPVHDLMRHSSSIAQTFTEALRSFLEWLPCSTPSAPTSCRGSTAGTLYGQSCSQRAGKRAWKPTSKPCHPRPYRPIARPPKYHDPASSFTWQLA